MNRLSKNAQVLKFFAQQYGRSGVPRKRLIKLAYMADILARQYLGRPISDFAYIKDHYGPNDRDVAAFAEEIEGKELGVQRFEHDPPRRTFRLVDAGKPFEFDFTPAENEILGYVVQNYLNMDIDEFIDDVVKQTDPFKAVDREGQPLPMHLANNTARKDVGFDLEEIIRAEEQAAAGNYLTLSAFGDELHARIAARYPEPN